MESIHIVERLPTLEEYLALRVAVGWGDLDRAMAECGLRNSLYGVCLVEDEKVIGCARVIGDGALYYYVQDVMVLPPYQGRGLGRQIMDHVMAYLRGQARTGMFVGLMAAHGAAEFYRKYGFVERPPDRPGMSLSR
ncbi:MAG TPA: GNAT family N-acetyltransferase [Ktedonobacterales bacterium]|jgi:GNAT superfamily N-acetyltransferase|nr:GNAT family N-acetyltransferase [Ktedonobacterales bacterium]